MSQRQGLPGAFDLTSLEPGQVVRLEDARGAAVTALSGNIWITQPGDAADHVIAAGQTFTIDRDGLTLMTALGGAGIVRLSALAVLASAPAPVCDLVA